MRLAPRVSAALLVGLGWAADRGAAQTVEPRLEALVTNRYLWRGIRRASGWNGQPQASLGYRRGRNGVAAGVWSNIELSTHRDSSLTDLQPGDWGPSEYDLWIEGTHGFARGHVAAGAVWYQYRGRNGDIGTGEIYLRYRARGIGQLKVSPELSVWYDPARRNSGYLEASLEAPMLALPFLDPEALGYTSFVSGFSLGRPDEVPELASSSYLTSGFAYADASAGLRIRSRTPLGSLIVNLAGHLMYARDPATRRKSLRPGEESRRFRPFLNFGVGLSWPGYPRQ